MGKREGKTEAPTPKKKQEAKKKGTVAKSVDLGPWLTLLIATYMLPWLIGSVGGAVVDALKALGDLAAEPDVGDALHLFDAAMRAGFFAVIPFMAVIAFVTVLTQAAQTGLVLSLHPLKPDFKRLNPIAGVKRLLSPMSLWETVKQVVKALLVGWIAWPHIEAIHDLLVGHGRVPLLPGLSATAAEIMAMTRAIAWAVVAVGLFDYAFQRRNKILDLKMTKQEVRDEMRSSEGDPQVKQRIRSLQMAMTRSRMMAAVPGASVVVTNPTHIAVALVYDPAAGGAPRVVAIGVDAVAKRIREKAAEANVPIVEAKPLARALWRACDVGDEIPATLYEAVAKVLAFVRRLRSSYLPSSPMPLPRLYNVDQTALDAVPDRRRRARRAAA
ncbi:MAG: EscU/YscU/HrcU family type III secretion system export apparatus switch protein [Actinomycetota bacterium]